MNAEEEAEEAAEARKEAKYEMNNIQRAWGAKERKKEI